MTHTMKVCTVFILLSPIFRERVNFLVDAALGLDFAILPWSQNLIFLDLLFIFNVSLPILCTYLHDSTFGSIELFTTGSGMQNPKPLDLGHVITFPFLIFKFIFFQ